LAVQALYACYSALAYKGSLELSIHVYSDRAHDFAPLRKHVDIKQVTEGTIRRWRGPSDYPYRMKIAALEDLGQQFPDHKLLFDDSDTFFVSNLSGVFERIGEHDSVLHVREYPVRTHATGQLVRFRKQMAKRSFRGGAVDLDADMWNSGAIGLHPRNFYLLKTMLAFIDAIAPHYKKQLLEQYAVSYYLQKNTAVHPCDDALFHYWQQKREYQRVIEAKLSQWKGMELQVALEELRKERIVLPPFVRRHGWVRRMRDKVQQFVTG
jgi:hypothetical protein